MKICVGGILLKDKKILLGKRSANCQFYPDVWDLIGGHCETNETLEQALVRELQEELGIGAIKFFHFETLYEPEPEIHGDYEYHIYLVTEWRGSPQNLVPKEHSELGWFKIEQILTFDLAHPSYPKLFKRLEMEII